MLKRISPLFILLFLVSGAFAQGRYDLKLNPDRSTYYVTTNTSSRIHMDLNGISNDIDQESKIVRNFHFTSSSDSLFTMEYMMDFIGMSMKVQGINYYSFSSEDPTTDENKIIKAMIDVPIKITLNERCKHVGRADFSRMLGAIEKILPGMGEYYLNSMSSNNESPINYQFPDKPVSIGETWSIKAKSSASGNGVSVNAVNDFDLTLKKVTGEIYIIEQKGYIKMQQNGIEFAGTIISHLKVDRKTGLLKESEGKGTLYGEGELNNQPYRAKTDLYFKSVVEKDRK